MIIVKRFFAKAKNPRDPLNGEIQIEKIDKDFLAEQASIAIKEYERSGYPHKGPLENVLGLTAEIAFDQFLKEAGLKDKDYEWNQRQPSYWDENNDKRPWDFKLKCGLTFEIGAARPYHHMAVFNLAEHKKQSDYFIQVQIKRFNCAAKVYYKGKERWFKFDANDRSSIPNEITNPEQLEATESVDIGECKICGFDKVETILKEENGWRFSPKGAIITPTANGIVKPLDELESVEQLVKLIKSKLKPKSLLDYSTPEHCGVT